MKLLAVALAATALASPVEYLQAHQRADGGFAEAGAPSSPAMTAWASLAIAANGRDAGSALGYLKTHDDDAMPVATRALVALAEAALGDGGLAASLPAEPGQTNAVIWTILALKQAGRPVPRALVQALRVRQARSGGWGWAKGVAPDSNDTATAVQALRAAGVIGAPVRRGLTFLSELRNADGGFALLANRESDAQSTAWAIQAFLAAGTRPPDGAFAYLARLRRDDGSYRYSTRYAVTPVWVTAQVVPAVKRTPFPLQGP